MKFDYNAIEDSGLWPSYKKALLQNLHFIEKNVPNGLETVYLFGSLVKGTATIYSDIDICCVFTDDTDLRAINLLCFKGDLACCQSKIPIDIVFVTRSQLISNSESLYQEINRAHVELAASV